MIETEQKAARLFRLQSELAEQLDGAVSAVRSGTAPDPQWLRNLVAEKAAVDRELCATEKQMREENATEEVRQRAEKEATRKKQLADTIAKMGEARQRVMEAVRLAALALGEWRSCHEPLTRLLNAADSVTGGVWPHELTAAREVTGFPDPYEDWRGVQYLPVDLSNTLRVKPVVKF